MNENTFKLVSKVHSSLGVFNRRTILELSKGCSELDSSLKISFRYTVLFGLIGSQLSSTVFFFIVSSIIWCFLIIRVYTIYTKTHLKYMNTIFTTMNVLNIYHNDQLHVRQQLLGEFAYQHPISNDFILVVGYFPFHKYFRRCLFKHTITQTYIHGIQLVIRIQPQKMLIYLGE